MAPIANKRRTRSTSRKPRTTHCKNRLVQSENEAPCGKKSSDNITKIDDAEFNGGCSTPKAQKYRIPEIVTCPPAPKKRRVASSCSLRRSPIAFFAPPDLELFFVFALGDIPD
ncbi:hypothetical protein RJ639_035802 [Escallonia herrerae]|uniref:Uncharacterized protein n=1 Tax=Escallonia herrerae TaxID=1293975 RepID=A0AA88WUC6_9ASTE|nr:hypothetical protein RJ639_035802 [Escallonia herrerae]